MGLNNFQTTSGVAEFTDIQTDSIKNNGGLSSESIATQFLADDYLYAGAFPGGDPDTRLDAALSAAASGDMIFLEADLYNSPRTVGKSVSLIGTGRVRGDSTTLVDQTLSADQMTVSHVVLSGNNALTLNSTGITITNTQSVNNASIQDNSGFNLFTNVSGTDITFASGTTKSLVDSSINVSVIDNGNNNVGNIS
jgi:hypothetical protein